MPRIVSFSRLLRPVAAVAAAAVLLGAAPASAPASDPNVTRATLDNGLSVVIVRDPLAPVVSVYDAYRVGADETPPDFPGMAHAQEHMAFRGCAGLSGDQTSSIYAELGGEGDADTQQDVTQYYATVPSVDLDVALHIDAACMRHIEDADADWDTERPAIEQEVTRDLSSATYLAFTRISADLFAGTPYERDPLGTRASFEKTTGADLQRFAQTWYVPNNAVLVIAGDVDPGTALASVRALYGSIPMRPVPTRPAVDLQPVKAETFSLDSDLPYVVVYQGYRFPGSDDPDYAAGRVLADVLGNARGSLAALTAQGKTLQSGFQFVANYPKASEVQAFGVVPSGGDPKSFQTSLAKIVSSTAISGVSSDLVEAAKRSEIASSEFGRNSIADLASTWSSALADEGRTSPDDDVAAIRGVTVDDVDRLARRVLDPAHAVTAVLTPRPSGGAIRTKGFGGGETLTSPPTKAVALPPWAQSLRGQIVIPNSTLAPTDETLPNGVRLIVQPESASDTVTVLGSIEHSDVVQVARGKDGVASLLSDLLPFGTRELDRLEYQKALDDIGASVTAGTTFSLRVMKANFDRGVALLADDELRPALPASDFTTVRGEDILALTGERQSAAYAVQRQLLRGLLPAGDPALRETTPATIAGVTLDDVKAYRSAVYRPDMTTIVVIGNVSEAEVRKTIEREFGTWSTAGPKPALSFPAIPQNAPSVALVPDRTRVRDATELVETVALRRTDPAYYALELGDRVLGGGFYASRLYRDLRAVAGLVDDVDVRLDAGKTRSTYSISFGSDPQNVSKARRLIARDLDGMRDADVTPAELQQAKAILLRQLPLAESSEDGVASGFVGLAQAGLPLDEAHRGAEIYARLNAADVRAAFARYVRSGGFVQVTQGPAPR
jgi:zinc protease